jgi:hypothetical protein
LGIAAFFLPMQRVEIDRDRREFRFVQQWPWGPGRTRATGFDEVQDVAVDVEAGEDGSETYNAQLILKSGRKRLLTSAGTREKRDAENAAHLVREAIRGRP